MNPFDLRWLWRAVRGRSVTFSLVFFLSMVGLSAPQAIRGLLQTLSVPWILAWIAPLILLGVLAKLEPKLIPSMKVRSRIALGLIAAGLVFLLVVPRLSPQENLPRTEEGQTETETGTAEQEESTTPNRIGPRGR